MYQNTACSLAGLAPFNNHHTCAHLTLLWGLHLFGLCDFQMLGSFLLGDPWYLPMVLLCLCCCHCFPHHLSLPDCLRAQELGRVSCCLSIHSELWGYQGDSFFYVLVSMPVEALGTELALGMPPAFTPLRCVCHPHGRCRHGLYLQQNKVTSWTHDLPPNQGTALYSNTRNLFAAFLPLLVV